MEEEFKVIIEHPEYLISNLGRVKRICNNNYVNGSISKRGYVVVDFRNRRKKTGRVRTVHQLVAITFINNPLNCVEVDHINNNKQDNNIVNLRWANSYEQKLNIPKYTKNVYSSIYKGVSKTKNNKWHAQCSKDNKIISLGTFITEREAAIAYNNYYITNNLTEYAYLNIIV